jgi:hypothetical protein
MDDEKNIYVTSHNQIGGITANNVNVGRVNRQFTESDAGKLNGLLDKYKGQTLSVTSVMGDPISYNLAIQIRAYLVNQGWAIQEGIGQFMLSTPVMGIAIMKSPRNGTPMVHVGYLS